MLQHFGLDFSSPELSAVIQSEKGQLPKNAFTPLNAVEYFTASANHHSFSETSVLQHELSSVSILVTT